MIDLICWQKLQYKKAAVFLSIASHLNPTVLVVGMVLIANYLFHVLCSAGIKKIWSRYREIRLLAVCFLPSVLPFAWNLFYAGRINLTATTETDLNPVNIFGRFKAYMLDWNLGFLPYFGILFILFLIVFAVSVWKRNGRVAAMGLAFFGTCLAYSIEIHINLGMSGLARYNAWASAIMIVTLFSCRKILACYENKETILLHADSSEENIVWLSD